MKLLNLKKSALMLLLLPAIMLAGCDDDDDAINDDRRRRNLEFAGPQELHAGIDADLAVFAKFQARLPGRRVNGDQA